MERTRISDPDPGEDGSTCPDPSRILAFMQHGLAAEASARLELHIDVCTECFALLADLAELGSEPEDARAEGAHPRRGT